MNELAPTLLLSVALLILVGFVAVRSGYLSAQLHQPLMQFVNRVAVPALLVNALIQDVSLALPEPMLLLGYFIPVLLVYLLQWRFSATADPQRRTLLAFGAAYSNIIFLGLPLTVAVFGDSVALLVVIIGVLNNLMLVVLAEFSSLSQRSGQLLKTLRSTLITPVVIAALAGLLLRSQPFELPLALTNGVSWLGKTTLPLACFCMGATLASFKISIEPRPLLSGLLLKNLLLPVLVASCCYGLGIDERSSRIVTFVAAMPSGFYMYILASRWQQLQLHAIGQILASSLLSLLVLSWLQM
ncbi:MAG: AEC family transporter [Motiliproteus sp.]